MSVVEYDKVEYKQTYLRGYFPVKTILKSKYNELITPNEYYDKYVTRISDELDTYERVMNLDDQKTYLYRMLDGYKYLVAILPVVSQPEEKNEEEE